MSSDSLIESGAFVGPLPPDSIGKKENNNLSNGSSSEAGNYINRIIKQGGCFDDLEVRDDLHLLDPAHY